MRSARAAPANEWSDNKAGNPLDSKARAAAATGRRALRRRCALSRRLRARMGATVVGAGVALRSRQPVCHAHERHCRNTVQRRSRRPELPPALR